MSSKARVRAIPTGIYRSKGEAQNAKTMKSRKIKFEYEPYTIPYVLNKNYTPDFVLENGIHIEYKGFLTPQDRAKMLAVRDQHPELDIRFVFQRASNKLSKSSKTTYGQWADKNKFKWADEIIPTRWAKEVLK